MPRVGAEQTFKTSKPYNQLSWITNDDNFDSDLFDVSSTIVRSLKAYPWWPFNQKRNSCLETYLHPAVVNYIEKRHLYMFSTENIRKQRKHMSILLTAHVFCLAMVVLKK